MAVDLARAELTISTRFFLIQFIGKRRLIYWKRKKRKIFLSVKKIYLKIKKNQNKIDWISFMFMLKQIKITKLQQIWVSLSFLLIKNHKNNWPIYKSFILVINWSLFEYEYEFAWNCEIVHKMIDWSINIARQFRADIKFHMKKRKKYPW